MMMIVIKSLPTNMGSSLESCELSHPALLRGEQRKLSKSPDVIAQGCGQTLGLGLGQSKDIVVVFY